jgi:hypothetical protein
MGTPSGRTPDGAGRPLGYFTGDPVVQSLSWPGNKTDRVAGPVERSSYPVNRSNVAKRVRPAAPFAGNREDALSHRNRFELVD